MKTLVYFVDGPNGAGKDYFIDNLVKSLRTETNQVPSIQILRATDFFISKETSTEMRKYTEYDTEQSKTLSIMIGHFKLLERIAELSRQQCDVVIVNRSFLSTLAYNLYKRSQLHDRRFYLDLFMNVFARYSEYVDMTFINMIISSDTLKIRQETRAEGKTIDPVWNAKLIDNYSQACVDLQHQGCVVVHKPSGSYLDIAEEILEFKKKEADDILAKHFLGGGPGG